MRKETERCMPYAYCDESSTKPQLVATMVFFDLTVVFNQLREAVV